MLKCDAYKKRDNMLGKLWRPIILNLIAKKQKVITIMFQFLKSKKTNESPQNKPTNEVEKGWLSRLSDGLKKTRKNLTDGLSNLVLGKKTIDEALFESLETILLTADMGIEPTSALIQKITERVNRKQLSDPSVLGSVLKKEMVDMLTPYNQPLIINQKPFVILMVGMNGAGKTTSIAKIANFYKKQGKSVMLAAGDTFRAAAVEQLQVWGERNEVPVIAQKTGADSASVIFDAMQSAQAKDIDIIIADTAGRLHTQSHLMKELEKIKRVIQKFNPDAPHETMLVIDATIGQNALAQAKSFHEAIGLNSLTVTKLDGTAKGGMVFSVTQNTHLPIRFIGVGEKIDDLKPFDATEFVEALFETNEPLE